MNEDFTGMVARTYLAGWVDAARVYQVCLLMAWLRWMGIEGKRMLSLQRLCVHLSKPWDEEELKREFASPAPSMARGAYGWRCPRCPDAGPWDTVAELEAHEELHR